MGNGDRIMTPVGQNKSYAFPGWPTVLEKVPRGVSLSKP